MKTKIILSTTLLLLLSSCGSDEQKYDASGVFEATEIIVSAESAGKILQFDIQEGEDVSVHQLIGSIDTVQLHLRKMQLLANIKAIQSRRPDIAKQIAATEEQIATAKRDQRRIENLLKEHAATQKQLDDITAQIAIFEKQLDAQRSTLENNNQSITDESAGLKIQIDQLDDQLQKSKILSPINGTILVKYAEQGELATVGKPLFKIADVQNMFLRAYVTSNQLTQLKIGQTVKVVADFGSDGSKEYSGTITWISSKSEFTPKTIQTKDERANLVYAIKVAVKNDEYIKIGMYGGLQLDK